MVNSKASYYSLHLQAALTAGQWASETPAKAPNGTALSWKELFRKFRKHNPESQDTVDLAEKTQMLSLLMLRNAGNTDDDKDGVGEHTRGPLHLGDECTLREERREEAAEAYDQLRNKEKTDAVSRTHLLLAYYAYALHGSDPCLSHLERVDFAVSSEAASLLTVPQQSRTSTLAVSLSIQSGYSAAGSISPSFEALDPQLKDGVVWEITERIRGRCLQGMSYERQSPPNFEKALTAYEASIPLITSVRIPQSPYTHSGRANLEAFTRYREFWRWVERLLHRAIIVAARTKPIDDVLNLLKIYRTQSTHWPSYFRPTQRSLTLNLHMRSLIKLINHHGRVNGSQHLSEIRSVSNDYRVLLGATTKFPRAGHRNVPVEEFVDLCVAAWDSGGMIGEQAGWVIDILWWATRYTFNSPRIYRHLTRLLAASHDVHLARRTLRVYVTVVSRARQSGDLTNPEEDSQWVGMLVQGARMLCRIPDGSVDDAKEALTLLHQARETLSADETELSASVDLAEGIANTALALKEQDPATRPDLLESALAFFERSKSLHDTASAAFHIALALSRPSTARDLNKAIIHARHAVELDPQEIRHWHLLGLLLAATEDWKGSKGIFEYAISLSEEEQADASFQLPATAGEEGVISKDFASTSAEPYVNGTSRLLDSLLTEGATHLDPAVTLQLPLPDYPPPSSPEKFEHILQLRKSQLALFEKVDGPESANIRWRDVFAWFAQSKGFVTRSEPETRSLDGANDTVDRLQGNGIGTESSGLSLDMTQSTVVPTTSIQIVPATPREETERMAVDTTQHVGMPNEPERKSLFGRHSSDGRTSKEHDRDGKKENKVQQILKHQVQKGRSGIHTISRKISRVNPKHGGPIMLHRSDSAPDFHMALSQARPYQASSIHSRHRNRITSWATTRSHIDGYQSPPAPVPPLPSTPPKSATKSKDRTPRERRLMSDLWLSSAATFRRAGKLDEVKDAIQEAESLDEENPDVWVQLGLYYAASGEPNKAVETFRKALFIDPDHVAAVVHITRMYLAPPASADGQPSAENTPEAKDAVDLAAGILTDITRGRGWDVPETWYLLAKACGMQGRKERERECLLFALSLVEAQSVRSFSDALGYCL
ncbi:TPR-like protein [Sistotremastrum niveocremeum HHB9708]|uniref:TPR-like protein n=1 Tax=Sistotremastrum niveocremeum HHB9708 TaxID=1314777 RepID=A0A164WRJ8_9AGAM|nr:TPR-like protein [Sistotremastrum niveocremeum HHB9708]